MGIDVACASVWILGSEANWVSRQISQYFYLMSVHSKVIDIGRRLADTQNVCEHCMFTVQGDCALFALYSNCAA